MHELKHKRSVLSKTETWKPGKISDIRHVVDSFFHDNGIIREVAESIISRKRFVVVDSVPVNKREVWDNKGNLVLVETFENGKVESVLDHYPPYRNLITNGSFEQHSEIPRHIVEEKFAGRILCQPIYSDLSRDTLFTSIMVNDTVRHILITRETRSGCVNDYSRVIERFALVETNGQISDSIFVSRPEFSHKGHYPILNAHKCNYNEINITIPGWKSLGRQFPDIYNLDTNSPRSPLWGLADTVFLFSSIEGNSFVRLNSRKVEVVSCNPYLIHPLLQTKLKSTMIKGEVYSIEFWLWKPKSYPDNKQLHICFSQESVTEYNYQQYLESIIKVDAFHDNTVHQWQKVSLTFKAPDFARYMTIGFFDFEMDFYPYIKVSKLRSCYLDAFVLLREPYKDIAWPDFYEDHVPPLDDFTL
jgi:hypothetical protein